MMNIKIVCIGKLSEKYLNEAQDEYLKRLKKFCKVEVIELPEEKIIQSKYSPSQEKIIIEKETNKVCEYLNKIKQKYVVYLSLLGVQKTSPEFADMISDISTNHSSTIVFVIGASLGFNDKINKISDCTISFSKLTFTHQFIRIFLLEQIYRSFKILNNERYHH